VLEIVSVIIITLHILILYVLQPREQAIAVN